MTQQYDVRKSSIGYWEVVPKPSAEELRRFYETKYFQQSTGPYAGSYSTEELEWFANSARSAAYTAERVNIEKSLLDLGCGEGFFAHAFLKAGWNVSCCDFSEFGIKTHNPELLPYFTSGDIYDSITIYKKQQQQFGLINLQNVLEHVIDPKELLITVKPLLGTRSVLRIQVPNDYSEFQAALVKQGMTTNTWFIPPEHLSYFNSDGLSALLTYCGYKICSLQVNFPIELFLANPNANYWRDKKLGKGAHKARIFCENYMINKDVNTYIEYAEVAAKLGFGRNLIAYATLES